jgi:glycosyltransferase involved in cell wall biosynthesis
MCWRAPASLSVVVCAYTERRWDQVVACLASLAEQQRVPDEIVLVIDHNDELLARARSAYSNVANVHVVANDNASGLSGARNTGVRVASGDVIAFVDDDARATAGWAERLLGNYGPSVAGVGGCAVAVWPVAPPRWLPSEFNWVVGCSWTGLPTTVAPVRNLIGANMSLRSVVLREVGAFSSSIGRVGTHPAGCEETELCIRVRERWPDAFLLYDPDLVVDHYLSEDRASPRYFIRRCWSEGRSKALVTGMVGSRRGLENERRHALRVIPAALLSNARAIANRRPGAIGRVTALTGGLALTSAGFVMGRCAQADQRRRQRATVDTSPSTWSTGGTRVGAG